MIVGPEGEPPRPQAERDRGVTGSGIVDDCSREGNDVGVASCDGGGGGEHGEHLGTPGSVDIRPTIEHAATELEHLGRPALVDSGEHRQQQPEGAFGSGVALDAELARQHQVCVLRARRTQQHGVPLGQGTGDDRVGGCDHRFHESLVQLIGLVGGDQFLERVLAQQLQQPVARDRAVGLCRHQGALDESPEQVQRGETVGATGTIAAGDGSRQTEVERTLEHPEVAEEAAFLGCQQGRRELDRGPHRIVPVAGGAGAAQHVEALIEDRQQIARRDRSRPGGGELDRQRQSVESTAQLGDIGEQRRVRLQRRSRCRRPLEEQRNRRGVFGVGPSRSRQRERLHHHDLFTGDPERLAARRQHDERTGGGADLDRHRAGGVEHVLAVVEQHDALSVGEHDGGGVE